jgi:hypothetical protein
MKRNLALLTAAVLATGLIAAGCGGDDDDGGGGESITKEEFIAEADAICREDGESIEQAGQDIQTEADVEDFILNTIVPTLREEVEQIRDLGAPAGDEDQINAMLDAVDEGLDEIEDDPSAATNTAANPLNEASRLAQDYGLQVCGRQ